MNLTPRENCTVEGGYQLSKIATWGVVPLRANTIAAAGHNDSCILVYKSIEYVQVIGIKGPTIFEDHCQSSFDPTRN